MRQRLQKFLPIFLLALAVQILAPIAGSWAAAIAISDPLSFAEICHTDRTSTAIGDFDEDGSKKLANGSCSICCLAQSAGSLDAPRLPGFSMPQWSVTTIIWRDRVLVLRDHDRGSNARARAPPTSFLT